MDLIFYNGEHAATFGGEWQVSNNQRIFVGGKNSWNDWHLVPLQKPVIPPPSVKMRQVDIPGAHGYIDMTTVLTGYPLYNARSGSLGYILAPGYEHWESVKMTVMEYLQGRTMKLYLKDDPGYYWEGIFWVNDLKSDAKSNSITINYTLQPFKKSIQMSDEDWLWDPFNFETGIAMSYGQLTVDGSLEVTVEDCYEPIMPAITASSAMTMTQTYTKPNGVVVTNSYNIPSGTTTPGFTLRPGTNTLIFTGNGTISISYRGGRL